MPICFSWWFLLYSYNYMLNRSFMPIWCSLKLKLIDKYLTRIYQKCRKIIILENTDVISMWLLKGQGWSVNANRLLACYHFDSLKKLYALHARVCIVKLKGKLKCILFSTWCPLSSLFRALSLRLLTGFQRSRVGELRNSRWILSCLRERITARDGVLVLT